MKRSASTFLLVALTACGGNVILDGPPGSTGHGGGVGSGGAAGHGGAGVGGSSMFVVATSSFSSTASTSFDGTGAGPCGSSHLYADPTCESCVEGNCCSQLTACSVGTPCFQALDCLVNCPQGNPGCQNACLAMSSDTGALTALVNCFNNACGTLPECGSPSFAVCDSGLPQVTTDACAECLTLACCTQAEVCAQSGVCQKCFAAQAMPGCDPSYDALSACEQSFCQSACSTTGG